MEKSYYGIDARDKLLVNTKLLRQHRYLSMNAIKDHSNGNLVPLKKIVFSAYHNPTRYYAEIQNRINTLVEYANERNLRPLFMTLTLPSKYHKAKMIKSGTLVDNPNYTGLTQAEGKKELTKMLGRLRQDRSLKELSKDERIFFRITEPHSDGTPHAHILLFVPEDRVQRIIVAFNRLFRQHTDANDIQKITSELNNAVAYVMKYINKTLPLSKKEDMSEKEKCLHCWYSAHSITRFNSSNSLAPITLYRKMYGSLSLKALTKVYKNNELEILLDVDKDIILEVNDKVTGAMLYQKNQNASMYEMEDDRRALNTQIQKMLMKVELD